MRPLLKLVGVCLGSLLGYALLFGFVVHKPLTIGIIAEQAKAKFDYAAQAGSPKLLIFAGSNARVSHRCETIEARLSMPCVNLGIGRGIGLDYLFAEFKPVIRPGDVVYMPLEYDWYLDTATQRMSGPDAALMFYGDKERLLEFGWERALRAAFHFDLPFLISGAVEMGLHAVGFRRRVNLETLTPQGDEAGHTLQRGEPYRAYVNTVQPFSPTVPMLDRPSDAQRQIRAFLQWAKQNGVLVVGGLQTTFDDASITDDVVAWLRRFYEGAGQQFLVLDGRSQYPRPCFFDTFAHLAEPCQIAHSVRLAEALGPLLRSRATP